MNDLQDLDLRSDLGDGGGEEEPPVGGAGRRGPWWLWPVVAALVLMCAAATWFLLSTQKGAVEAPTPPAETAEPPAAEPREAVRESEPLGPLPELDASDALVRDLVAALSARPELVEWLATEDLVRRFVVAVVNVSEGESPRPHVGFLAPAEAFAVSGSGPSVVIDKESFARYRTATEVFASLDTKGMVSLFHRLEPLLDEAYRDLGYPGRSFEGALKDALGKVLEVEPIDGPIELVPGVESFRFADPELERSTPLTKQLLRLGPQNLRRVQGKARELLSALEAEPGRG